MPLQGQFVTPIVEGAKSHLPDSLLQLLNISKNQTIYEKQAQEIMELEANIWFDRHKIKELEAKVSVLYAKLQNTSITEAPRTVKASKEESSTHALPSLPLHLIASHPL